MEKKKKKNSPVGTIIFMVLLAGVIIGLYFMLTRGKENNETGEIPVESSEADLLIKKDLIFDYPATPREVLKLYSRITKCLYNDELTDDQIKKLVQQVRLLYNTKLLENNSEEDQIKFLKGEISEYKKEKKIIYAYTIDSSNNTEYIKTTAGNTALIKMYFTLRAGADMKRTYEEFSLVEDSSGRWKIAGWKTVDSQSWD
ncbi:MAG: hypothetical protein IKP88_07730 [Lachnospiraceae bacterium]|nr:hypothetical protein [Lachnospiraceae bacterium]